MLSQSKEVRSRFEVSFPKVEKNFRCLFGIMEEVNALHP